MDMLASVLVGQPIHILAVAGVVLVGHFLLRVSGFGSERHPRALLVVVAIWVSYAAWEWLVVTLTPEANIRVDLLLIWPVLLVTTVWMLFRSLR